MTCICPRQCGTSDECADNETCFHADGNCGRGGYPGYCLPITTAPRWLCNQKPICGCDGALYDDGCAAIAARTSPSAAETSDCSARPLPCMDNPLGVSCYPNQYCTVRNSVGSVSAWCASFDTACAQPSCDCIRYADTCTCEQLPSGLVKLTCPG